MTKSPFWKNKPLSEFSAAEWESICTHCGRCCQLKLEDEDSGEIYFTDIVCRYFNAQSGCCTEYANRCSLVPECLKLTPDNIDKIPWMPKRCAYRILNQTGNLPDWHPLITGRPLSPEHTVCGRVVSELLIKEEDFEDHIIEEDDDDRSC